MQGLAALAARARQAIAARSKRLTSTLTLEELLTAPDLGAFRPSPVQLALVRAADGTLIEGLLTPGQIAFHFGSGVRRPSARRP